MRIPRRKSDELRARDEEPVYLTKEGFEKLEGKLERLKRALPDLSRNRRGRPPTATGRIAPSTKRRKGPCEGQTGEF